MAGGLVVNKAQIAKRLDAELPFMATEEILMAAVARGGDRQELHECIRRHAQKAGEQVKKHGRPNDLIERLKGDPAFAGIRWSRLLDPKRHVGLAPQQTREYVKEHVHPLLKRFAGRSVRPAAVNV